MVRPSDPPPPLAELRDEALLEQLCLALRDAARPWPGALSRVRRIDEELKRRGVESDSRVARLTDETGWLMPELLAEGRAFPEVTPRVRRKSDGLRIGLLCHGCWAAEHPAEPRTLLLCDRCLRHVDDCIAARRDAEHLMPYRTDTRDAG